MFRAILRFGDPLPRLVTGLLVLALIPIGPHLGAAQQLAGTAALISAMLLLEHRAAVRDRSRIHRPGPGFLN